MTRTRTTGSVSPTRAEVGAEPTLSVNQTRRLYINNLPDSPVANSWLFTSNPNLQEDVTVVAGTAPTGGSSTVPLYTTNNGISWSTSTGLNTTVVAMGSSRVLRTFIAVDNRGQVYKSSDNGFTWERIRNLPVEFEDDGSDAVLSVGEGGDFVCYYSSGKSYKYVNSTDSYLTLPGNLNVSTNSNQLIRSIVYCGNQTFIAGSDFGFISRSTDNGATWTALTRGLGHSNNETLKSSASNESGTVFINAGSDIYMSRDFGVTWSSANLPVAPSSFLASDISTDGNGTWFFAGNRTVANVTQSLMLVSDDDGSTWRSVTPPTPPTNTAEPYSSSRISVDSDGNALTILSQHRNITTEHDIYRSVDLGLNWIRVLTGTTQSSKQFLIRSYL